MKRLREPSTYAGLAVAFGSIAPLFGMDAGQAGAIASIIASMAVFLPEGRR
jgi:hypothetical protein